VTEASLIRVRKSAQSLFASRKKGDLKTYPGVWLLFATFSNFGSYENGVQGSIFRVQGSNFGVQGSNFGVQGSIFVFNVHGIKVNAFYSYKS
jgi:hypothetical protein